MREEFKRKDRKDIEIDKEKNIQLWNLKLMSFKKKTNFLKVRYRFLNCNWKKQNNKFLSLSFKKIE